MFSLSDEILREHRYTKPVQVAVVGGHHHREAYYREDKWEYWCALEELDGGDETTLEELVRNHRLPPTLQDLVQKKDYSPSRPIPVETQARLVFEYDSVSGKGVKIEVEMGSDGFYADKDHVFFRFSEV